ncbi:hypothetical protein MATL_G00209450 [Megalops atlanticus]|uniref:Small ribosomal subunit protein uS2 C-terminal domain-containing protein n=1 Tax=Megalops atlanticus TaxID=7932 RepID=A0A9D3SXC4_MEGAT|nr:hypothetical protein MATL_G00209450 [Megalops atlanticus]
MLRIEKEEQAMVLKAMWTALAAEFAQPEVADGSEGVQVPSIPIQQFPAEDWSAQLPTKYWSAAPTAHVSEWGGASNQH